MRWANGSRLKIIERIRGQFVMRIKSAFNSSWISCFIRWNTLSPCSTLNLMMYPKDRWISEFGLDTKFAYNSSNSAPSWNLLKNLGNQNLVVAVAIDLLVLLKLDKVFKDKYLAILSEMWENRGFEKITSIFVECCRSNEMNKPFIRLYQRRI